MIDFKKRVLDNGLTVIAEQENSTSMVAINILYNVGSRDEHPDRTGLAHLFEHLMFGGSAHAPDFDTPLQLAGGENNATTNTDYTSYYDSLPLQNVETAFWLEADRMQNLIITEKSMSIQRKVVIEEFNEVCLNRPYGNVWHHIGPMAYNDHPYSWPTIGKSPDHVANMSVSDAKKFYSRYYNPTNAYLSICGPMDTDDSFALAEKWFGPVEGERHQTPLYVGRPQTEVQIKEVFEDVPAPTFVITFHMPDRKHPDYCAIDLLTELLCAGESSFLHYELVRSKEVLSMITGYVNGNSDRGLIVIEGQPMPEIDLEDALKATLDVVLGMKSRRVEDYRMEKVKNQTITAIVLSDLGTLSRAMTMAYFAATDYLTAINNLEKYYDKVQSEDILTIANKYLVESQMCILKYRPLKEKPSSIAMSS